MKPKKKRSLIPLLSTQMTAMVSVALVLFVLGIVGLLAIGAHRATTAIKQQIGFVVLLDENASEKQVNDIKRSLGRSAAIADYRYSSADEVLRRWKNDMGADGEMDEVLSGVNPFVAEIDVNMMASHSHPDSLAAVVAEVEKAPGVKEVKANADTAREVSRSVDSVLFILAAVALALLIISFVLINNTIRLSIYSKRFQIHTMKLVGATAGYIRKPFVGKNIISGIFAAFFASAALWGALCYLGVLEPQIYAVVRLRDLAWATIGIFAVGVAICAVASLFATNKYIGITYDEMFK